MSEYNPESLAPQTGDDEDNSLRNINALLWQVVQGQRSLSVGQVAGAQQAVAVSLKSASYTVPAGSYSVGLIFSDDFVGTVQGVAFSGDKDVFTEFTARPGNTLGAIAVTRSAGTFRVLTS